MEDKEELEHFQIRTFTGVRWGPTYEEAKKMWEKGKSDHVSLSDRVYDKKLKRHYRVETTIPVICFIGSYRFQNAAFLNERKIWEPHNKHSLERLEYLDLPAVKLYHKFLDSKMNYWVSNFLVITPIWAIWWYLLPIIFAEGAGWNVFNWPPEGSIAIFWGIFGTIWFNLQLSLQETSIIELFKTD